MLDRRVETGLRAVDTSHEAQLELCRVLEAIADTLPEEVDPRQCAIAAASLHDVMAVADRSYHDQLAPALSANAGAHLVDLGPTARRLLRENQQDIDHAEELQDLLTAVAESRQTVSAEALGYLLRGFFDSRRRRIALEQELLAALRDEKS